MATAAFQLVGPAVFDTAFRSASAARIHRISASTAVRTSASVVSRLQRHCAFNRHLHRDCYPREIMETSGHRLWSDAGFTFVPDDPLY
jgi:hypothetical protein